MEFLRMCLSSEPNERKRGEEALNQAAQENPATTILALMCELGDEQKDKPVRQLAGIYLKNMLTARGAEMRKILQEKWANIPENVRSEVKVQSFGVFSSNVAEARRTAAWLLSHIILIELPRDMWANALGDLLQGAFAGSVNQKEAVLQTLGFVCEGIVEGNCERSGQAVLQHIGQILTAIVSELKTLDTPLPLRTAAARALLAAIDFAQTSMNVEQERNVLVHCAITQTQDKTDITIRTVALETLARMAQLYYDHMAPYMQDLFRVTMEAIQHFNEEAMQGIEFWSTICDVEMESGEHKGYAKAALQFLIPLLYKAMMMQEVESDDDTWNLSTAAGTCLSLLSQVCGDAVLVHVGHLINLTSPEWRQVEASAFSIGSVMDGTQEETVAAMVQQCIPTLILILRDPQYNELVRDTSAWALGRVAEFFPDQIRNHKLTDFLVAMGEGLDASYPPRVSAKCAWSIQMLCTHWDILDEPPATYQLSPFFDKMVERLLQTIHRPDAAQHNLRHTTQEALTSLIGSAAVDCIQTVSQLVPQVVERIRALSAQHIDKELTEMKGIMCGTLQVCARKLGKDIAPFADSIIATFIEVFRESNTLVLEETLMAVGAVAAGLGEAFEKYTVSVLPAVEAGLKSHQEPDLCIVAVGCVGDIASALTDKFIPFARPILETFLELLRTEEVSWDIKTEVISTFGDVCLAIGHHFQPFLDGVMRVLNSASSVTFPDEEEMEEIQEDLWEAILTAYTGIMQGLKDTCKEQFTPYITQVLTLVEKVGKEADDCESKTVKCAVEVLGDLANLYGKQVAYLKNEKYVLSLCKAASEWGEECEEALNWCKEQLGSL